MLPQQSTVSGALGKPCTAGTTAQGVFSTRKHRDLHRRHAAAGSGASTSDTKDSRAQTQQANLSSEDPNKAVLVRSLPPVRAAAAPPEPVPIQHSQSFLLRKHSKDWDAQPLAVTKSRDEEPFTGNAVEWVVRRVDASLDEAEMNPPPGARALIGVARGPVGSATVQGVTAAARVTVQVGATALKAAAPVGKWVVQQSFKAALGLVTSDGFRKPERRRNNSQD